jgi:membrane associated rhomboid family serine protease
LLTASVFAVTAAVSAAQFADHAILTGLERTPAGLSGEWWRSFTALFVQDGGLPGTLSNLAFLLVIGTIAEQVLSRPRWLLLYFIPGLAAELAGYAWQPVGAGNSGAVCGLAGGLIVAMLAGRPRPGPHAAGIGGAPSPRGRALLAPWPAPVAVLPPWPAPLAVTCWLGALAATVAGGGSWAAAVIFAAGLPAVIRIRRRGGPAGRIVAAAGVAEAVILLALGNIHGAALAAGIVLAGLLAGRIPGRPGFVGWREHRRPDWPAHALLSPGSSRPGH